MHRLLPGVMWAPNLSIGLAACRGGWSWQCALMAPAIWPSSAAKMIGWLEPLLAATRPANWPGWWAGRKEDRAAMLEMVASGGPRWCEHPP